MKTYATIVVCIFFLIASKSDTKEYFDFDQIDYYHVNFDSKKDFKAFQDIKSKEEKTFFEILRFNSNPTKVDDPNFIKDLSKRYRKKEISKEKFSRITEIYSEKKHADPTFYSCAPFYRDILVFKKNKKVIGISKICFECNLHYTIGSKRNTQNLGQSGDFQKLQKLLK
jgi:hypothetical protein